ncbi:Protein vip1 [Golovinomyces cichoracearum]|uniref:Protein vip1 n=1 Tax=Golovinomyces cichoracearum TaxID=62708 RepID=A0A420J9R0_9PEZI|nr:Protein vip1 [Golovinomyces cichoracearum]
MSSNNVVYVKNISAKTSESEIKEFFSFCGKITNLEIVPKGQTQEATVKFEKETAARTAQLLDNTHLGQNQVKVTSATGFKGDDVGRFTEDFQRDSDEITQEEKPRARIVAEYLAHGYVLGDQTLQRAIDLDNKHGVTARFLSTLQKLDDKYHATDRAKSVDKSYGVTPKVNNLLSRLSSFYEKAADTSSGKKLVNFYSQTSRQVLDIHNEACRLANLKKETSATSSPENRSPAAHSVEQNEKIKSHTSVPETNKAISLESEKKASAPETTKNVLSTSEKEISS